MLAVHLPDKMLPIFFVTYVHKHIVSIYFHWGTICIIIIQL